MAVLKSKLSVEMVVMVVLELMTIEGMLDGK